MEVNYLDLVGEGYMGSMQWQLGREMGTIPAFASRTQENQENLGRGGRSQDLPDSANKYMREWLWIECQQVYERTVMNRVPTSTWENGYE